jgi:hypothetical protein
MDFFRRHGLNSRRMVPIWRKSGLRIRSGSVILHQLAQKSCTLQDRSFARYLKCGMTIKADLDQCIKDLTNSHDPFPEGNRAHATTEAGSPIGLHGCGHVLPMYVLDPGSKSLDETQWISSTQPQVARIEVEGEGRGIKLVQ